MARIIPERIREARESVGLTDEQFAEAIGVTRQSVGNYESGVSTPRGETFGLIVSTTRQPPAFFTSERRIGAERFRMPNWRSLKRMQRPERLRIGRRLEWAFYIADLVDRYVELPPVNLPEFDFDWERDSDERIEEIADELREAWNLGFSPIQDLTPTLEYHGFILLEQDVDCTDMDAVSRWQGGRPFILYSKETDSPRCLFNLAHELGHLILHNSMELNSRVLDRVESQANRFAGAFLLPRRSFVRDVASTSVDYFISLKSHWRVSVACMVYRCRELEIINPYQVKYLWKQMNYRNIRKKEPLDEAFYLSSPVILSSAISMILQSKRMSAAQIADELALNPADIESLACLPTGTLDQKVVSLRLGERSA